METAAGKGIGQDGAERVIFFLANGAYGSAVEEAAGRDEV
jgi:hypothetical protein